MTEKVRPKALLKFFNKKRPLFKKGWTFFVFLFRKKLRKCVSQKLGGILRFRKSVSRCADFNKKKSRRKIHVVFPVIEKDGPADPGIKFLKFIRKGGGLCELGFIINGGDATINPHFDICSKEITTVGSWVYTLRDYATTLDFLKSAKQIGLPMEKLITHTYSLDEINEAHKTNLAMSGLKIAIINE